MSDPTDNGDRPDRSERNSARSNERAARNNERSGQSGPRSTGDRPARGSSERPERSGERSDRPARSFNDRSERPARSDDRPDRPDRPARSGDRPDRPARSSDRQPGRPSGDRDRAPRQSGGARPPRDGDKKLWTDRGAPARGNQDAGARNAAAAAEWEDRDPFNTRSVRNRHDDPIIPDDVSADDLDRVARNELKTLAKDNQEGVAQHLAMAARLIESDPTLAHAHAMSAARRAGRIGVVRETLAITAYATGDYALALRELRTHRRITGRDDQLPLMVDCERALGRPDKALELARSIPKASLSVPVQVELAIAMSGARLDQGNPQAALQEVTIPQLDPTRVFSYSPDLFAAYATCLEDLGREAEAEVWWTHADTAQEALDQRDLGIDGETIDIYEDDEFMDDQFIDEELLDGELITTDSDSVATTDDETVAETPATPDSEETNAPTETADAADTGSTDSENTDTHDR